MCEETPLIAASVRVSDQVLTSEPHPSNGDVAMVCVGGCVCV